MSSTAGNICVARNTSRNVCRPANRKRARAKPARMDTTVVATMVTDETHRLLAKKRLKGVSRQVRAST